MGTYPSPPTDRCSTGRLGLVIAPAPPATMRQQLLLDRLPQFVTGICRELTRTRRQQRDR